MLELYKPLVDDLWFKEEMMGDEQKANKKST